MYLIKNLFSIEGKTIIITGASGQLGSEFVTALILNGANVIASDLSKDCLIKAKKNHNWDSEKVVLAECDITDEDDVIKLVSIANKNFGDIDGFVANAGTSVFEPFLDRPKESIEKVLDVNLKGTILCAKHFLNYRKDKNNRKSSLIFIGSVYGVVSPDPRIYTDLDRKNSEVYGASKAGIIQLAKYYSVHGAEYNVRANVISPGGIYDNQNPQGEEFQKNYKFRCPSKRMATTRDMIGALIYLLSDSSDYVNGENININGGFSSW